MARQLTAPALESYPAREGTSPEPGDGRTTRAEPTPQPGARAGTRVGGALGAGVATESTRVADKPGQRVGVRTGAEGVAARTAGGPASSPGAPVEALVDAAQRHGAVRMVEQSARRDLLRVMSWLPEPGPGNPPRGAQQRHIRTLVATEAVCRPMRTAALADLLRTGGELAVCEELPVQAVIADESLAVVSVGDPHAPTAVLLRAPGLVRMVRQWAEGLWEQAAPLRSAAGPTQTSAAPARPGAGSAGGAGTGPPPTNAGPGRPGNAVPRLSTKPADTPTLTTAAPDRGAVEVLEHLAAGLKDEAIGRALGISARTVRRRVADLEARFGATNRIQLVARAATQGWVTV